MLAELQRAGVHYKIVGDAALDLLGLPRATKDLDVFVLDKAERPRERFDSFRALVADVFCPMEIDRHRSVRDAFRARVDAVNLGHVKLVRVSTGPLQVRRRPQDLAHIPASPYLVKFQLKGESLWSQRGRQVHARPGDFVSPRRPSPTR